MTVLKRLIIKPALILLIAWVIGRGATPALADIVEFGEINSLHGSVISYEKGVIVFSTKYVKRIRIPVEQIRSISTDRPIAIKMKDDSIMRGTLTTLESGQVAVIMEPDGELVPLDWSQVKTINPPPDRWTGDFALGGNAKSGNTNSTTLNMSMSAKRQWGRDRFQFHYRFNFESEDNIETDNDSFMSIKFDHFFTENTFAGLSLEAKKDAFKDIELQAITGLGLGYRFWNDEDKVLELQLGIAYFSDDRIKGPHSTFMTGRLSLVFSYKFLTYFSIEESLLYYPSLDESDENKIRNELALISRLGTGWAVRLTYILDKDSLAEEIPGIQDIDNRFIFAIQYSF